MTRPLSRKESTRSITVSSPGGKLPHSHIETAKAVTISLDAELDAMFIQQQKLRENIIEYRFNIDRAPEQNDASAKARRRQNQQLHKKCIDQLEKLKKRYDEYEKKLETNRRLMIKLVTGETSAVNPSSTLLKDQADSSTDEDVVGPSPKRKRIKKRNYPPYEAASK